MNDINKINFTNEKNDDIVKNTKRKVKNGVDLMGFSKEKRDRIEKYICEKIGRNQEDIVKRTAEVFEISLNTVYRYIRELERYKVICKRGKKYELVAINEGYILNRSKGDLCAEDSVYEKYIAEYIKGLPNNVIKIWQYSFMEMMNNAIDHSEAEQVGIFISQNFMETMILIQDNGIGIFKKIKEYYGYNLLDDAVNELFKGKLTTDKNNHSGEGIFFTSRILDKFSAISDGKIFTHNKYSERLDNLENIETMKHWKSKEGTTIFMGISNFSNKELKGVFDMFSDVDGGFTKTNIPIKNIFETFPVSRSQAKRLYHRFEKFKEVEIDFDGIEEIGQGFAHEIFVVFQNNHKDIVLKPVNMTDEVKKMVNHVRQTDL